MSVLRLETISWNCRHAHAPPPHSVVRLFFKVSTCNARCRSDAAAPSQAALSSSRGAQRPLSRSRAQRQTAVASRARRRRSRLPAPPPASLSKVHECVNSRSHTTPSKAFHTHTRTARRTSVGNSASGRSRCTAATMEPRSASVVRSCETGGCKRLYERRTRARSRRTLSLQAASCSTHLSSPPCTSPISAVVRNAVFEFWRDVDTSIVMKMR